MQVTLKLEPLFKRSITYVTKNDSDLGDELLTFGTKHEFADVMWYPSQKKAVYRIDDRVPVSANGTGLYNFFPFRSTPSVALAVVRSTGSRYIFIFFIINQISCKNTNTISISSACMFEYE